MGAAPEERRLFQDPSVSDRELRAAAILIVFVGALVYLNSFKGQFVFDDVEMFNDDSIRQL